MTSLSLPFNCPRYLRAAVLTLAVSTPTFADNEADLKNLLSVLEEQYPTILSPANDSVGRLDGYIYRYYTGTEVYLALFGDQVYGLGGPLGNDIVAAGSIEALVAKSVSDITGKPFELRGAQCSYYTAKNVAAVTDLSSGAVLGAKRNFSVAGSHCTFSSNGLPNHDVGGAAVEFVAALTASPSLLKVSSAPRAAAATTGLTDARLDAVMLNGAFLRSLDSICYTTANAKATCNNANQAWRYDSRSSQSGVALDAHHGHVDSDGGYHYHGASDALFDQFPTSESPVIGFAADGFPLYGSYFTDANGELRVARSSYALKSGARPAGTDSPGGNYDGTYRDDYEYVEGAGDLDECNGMARSGGYGYYATNTYPWAIGCLQGTPNSSFIEDNAADESLPQVQLVNYTDYGTAELNLIANAVAEQAVDRIRDIKVFVWPIGEQMREPTATDREYMAFTPHTLVMSSAQIETLFGEMMAWINESCPNIDYREVAEQEQRLRYLLENGGDAATLSVPCYTVGMGLVANNVNQDINTLKHIIAHETYHGIQQDLAETVCRDRREQSEPNNARWIAEGAADYVARMALAKLDGGINGEQRILKYAYGAYRGGELDMSTYQGAAALLLMVKRGELDERTILDASISHDCKVLDVYNDTNAAILNAKASWFMIEETVGDSGPTYAFTAEALGL